MAVDTKIAGSPSGVPELAEQHVILSSMVAAKQEAVRALQHEESITTINIQRLKREQEDALAQQGLKLQQQRDDHAKQLEIERLQLKRYESELNSRDSNLQSWEKDLKEWEKKIDPLKAKEAELVEQRIEIEQIRVRAGEMEQRASQLESVYNNRLGDLVQREAEVKRAEEHHTVLGQNLEAHQTELDKKDQAVSQDLRNLVALREELDPKLSALAEREKTVGEQVIRAESLHAEATQKQAEQQETLASLQALSARLEAREKVLTEYQATLKAAEQDLTLKVASAKAQGVSVSEVPKTP